MTDTPNDNPEQKDELVPPWTLLMKWLVGMVLGFVKWLEKFPDRFDKWTKKIEEEQGEAQLATRLFIGSFSISGVFLLLFLWSVGNMLAQFDFLSFIGQAVFVAVFGVLVFIGYSLTWFLFQAIFEGLENDRKKAEKENNE